MASTVFRIVLVGKTGSGKSSTGNTIMGPENSQSHFTVAASSQSVTKTCERREVPIDDPRIFIIDTPGLFDTTLPEQDFSAEIKKCVCMSVPGPHVFLLVIRLDVRFTDEERNTVRWIQRNFGEDATRYTIILFTHADALERPLDEYISESNDLQALVDVCGGRFHSFNNRDMENRHQVTKLLEKIKMMVVENGGQHYSSEIYREAQRQIRREALQQNLIQFGRTALAVAGGIATVGAVGAAVAAGGAAGAAGAGGAAIARAAVAAGARGAVAIAGRAAVAGGLAAALRR